MKKLFMFFICAIALFAFVACNDDPIDDDDKDKDVSLDINESHLDLKVGEEYTFNTTESILMQSSNSSVVKTIESEKKITALSVGEATVTIYAAQDTTVSKSITVKVTDDTGNITEIKPESIEIILDKDWLYLEDSMPFSYKVYPEEASQEINIKYSKSFVSIDLENFEISSIATGKASIIISPASDKSITAQATITIKDCINPDTFFQDFCFTDPVAETVIAFGWQEGTTWNANLNGSVTKYLFEDINVTERYISTSLPERPGTIMTPRFVVFHDTADAYVSHDASWIANYCNTSKDASWHYTVDDTNIFQTLPINEVGWHAGCGTDTELVYTDTLVPATSTSPATVTISSDGYFEMNGVKTAIKAPLKDDGSIPTNENIPYTGIENYVNLETNTYWIGNTWWSEKYQHVGNYGGNLEAVGIESCVNNGNDIWKTWARSAKLIGSVILPQTNLTPAALRQHNSFSGKDCPMTMRHADKWEEFVELVTYEYMMNKYFKSFKVKFEPNCDYIDSNGLIKYLPNVATTVTVKVIVESSTNNYSNTFEYKINLPSSYTQNCNETVPYMQKYLQN